MFVSEQMMWCVGVVVIMFYVVIFDLAYRMGYVRGYCENKNEEMRVTHFDDESEDDK